jgi:parallel beta-helix repeat protein
MKRIISLWLCFVLVASSAVVLVGVGDGPVEGMDAVKYNVNYIASSPFRINSNAEFATSSKVTNGNGSEGNPWVIENFEINGTGYGYCIFIGNTTDYFVVKDCYLHHAYERFTYIQYWDSGLALFNVQNGKIVNITAQFNTYGIRLESSRSNNLINNTVSNNEYGVYLYIYCNNNTITNINASLNNRNGIYLWFSSENTISNSSISNNIFGICLAYSDNNTISNNIISNNIPINYRGYISYGISLESSCDNTLFNNTMVKNGVLILGTSITHWNTHNMGITNTINGMPVIYCKNQDSGIISPGAGEVILANCTNVTIEKLNISNTDVGILLGFSNDNHIANNTAFNNSCGIILYASHGNIFVNNTVSNNDLDGIKLEYSTNNTVIHCTFANNHDYGIWAESSTSNTIANNNASSNNYIGIRLRDSNSNNISNNTVLDNEIGIELSSSSNNFIFQNNVSNNQGWFISGFGIRLEASSCDNTISDNFLSNNDKGISLYWDCHNNKIVNNTAISNIEHSIHLESSDSNFISGNTLSEYVVSSRNGNGIYIQSSDDNRIINNTASLKERGIYIFQSNRTLIANNTVSSNYFGIYLDLGCQGNTIVNNLALSNGCGIRLDSTRLPIMMPITMTMGSKIDSLQTTQLSTTTLP